MVMESMNGKPKGPQGSWWPRWGGMVVGFAALFAAAMGPAIKEMLPQTAGIDASARLVGGLLICFAIICLLTAWDRRED